MSTSDEVSIYSGGGASYDPDAPIPYWHQRMELITICVCNSLSLLIIITRLIVRRNRIKKFRKDDIWILVAGAVLIFPHWTSQIGTNRFGSGLHSENIPDEWLVPFWLFQIGWVGYYIVLSMIKTSVCFCLLEILPHSFRTFRRCVYALCTIIMALGIAESLVWIFQCQPFMSNFNYDVQPVWCVDIDKARYSWIGISIPIDIAIISIPFAIIRQIRLERHERIVLYLVFGANLLGTFTSIFGIYGVWQNRESNAFADLSYSQTIYIMTNDIEILMYTVGASATVFSRYFISKAAAYSNNHRSSSLPSEQLSWRRKMESTFSGSYTLPSTWAGETLGQESIALDDSPSSPYKSKRQHSEISVMPVLNDVGGLGTVDIERDPRRHNLWYSSNSSHGSPTSAATAWDWGSTTKF